MRELSFLFIFLGSIGVASATDVTFQKVLKPFIDTYCVSCHDEDVQKGGIAFHNLESINAKNAPVWKSIWEQVALKDMPPPDKKKQPHGMHRHEFTQSIVKVMEQTFKDSGGFYNHLHPQKGNLIDHDLLFGKIPANLEPPSTPARLWRIDPQEHLTRLNDLVSMEPVFDKTKPGLRARGDMLPIGARIGQNIYLGLDSVYHWGGTSFNLHAHIDKFPKVLSTRGGHGFMNYSHLYTVDGNESMRIASQGEKIVRYLALGPQVDASQLAKEGAQPKGKILYFESLKFPKTPVYKLMQDKTVSSKNIYEAVKFLYESLTFRRTSKGRLNVYMNIVKNSIKDLGHEDGVIHGLVPIFLDKHALFRSEIPVNRTPDKYGRVMLQGDDLAVAINAAFSYVTPNKHLFASAKTAKLRTKSDVKREVVRILKDDSIRKPVILQFFREFFDYMHAKDIDKDDLALAATGGKKGDFGKDIVKMIADTDRLVEYILHKDKNVLSELLTTNLAVVPTDYPQKPGIFTEVSKGKPMKGPKKVDSQDVYVKTDKVHEVFFHKGSRAHKKGYDYLEKSKRKLVELPKDQRMGILTHPIWLVSHSDAMDNHAIHRGIWIRERLLGGGIADVPITVDAMLPEEPENTLRERMRVTRVKYCWSCHEKMDPLGLTFEMFNHAGFYRKTEKGKPVDTSGEIVKSGDPNLDGPVKDAFEMIQKLAKSERVKQVFVRHAFRFWMGRNETLNDAPVLQNAYKAYSQSGGSMKALLLSLLTSDAFLYRKVETHRTLSKK